jgi:hypothetical protein
MIQVVEMTELMHHDVVPPAGRQKQELVVKIEVSF